MQKFVEPIQEINSKVNDLIRQELIHHTCQLFSFVEGKMEPFGSGVFSKLGDSYYILTASHVAEYINGENINAELYIKCKDGYVSVRGDVRGTEINNSSHVDLAYIKLNANFQSEISENYKFLPISRFRRHDKLIDAAQYCVLGFPEKNQKINNGILRTGASAFVLEPCKEKVYKYYELNSTLTYILEMKGKGVDLSDGAKNIISSDFYGISGCGLWFLIMNHDGNDYHVDYRLIGIMTNYRKGKYYCLIGYKIEILLDAINKFEKFKYQVKHV